MKIKLWGVRGSLPTPLSTDNIQNKIRRALSLARPGDISSEAAITAFLETLPFSVRGTYGGNSTCIEVRSDTDDLIIIDGGSGLKNLGMELMQQEFSRGRGVGNFFMTHTHWDHVQGIPFFVPFYVKGNLFNFYSPLKDLRARLEFQQEKTHFPVDLNYMAAEKKYLHFEPDSEFYLNNMRIINKTMPHPGGAFGYRFEENGKSFAFTSDCEFNYKAIDAIKSYRPFFDQADIVVFDTQYTFEESFEKMDYGHSSASIAIDIACKFQVKHLILFHHDPNYNDEKLDNVLSNAITYMNMSKRKGIPLKIDIAREGMEFNL